MSHINVTLALQETIFATYAPVILLGPPRSIFQTAGDAVEVCDVRGIRPERGGICIYECLLHSWNGDLHLLVVVPFQTQSSARRIPKIHGVNFM